MSLNPPVHARANCMLFERVPVPFMGDFKGPQVKLDLHLELAFESFRHSPRAPAGTASAIFKAFPEKSLYYIIENLQIRGCFDDKCSNRVINHILFYIN